MNSKITFALRNMNLKNYTAEQLAKMMRGKLVQKGQQVSIENLLLDSRKLTIAETTAFFAIKGDRRNGHQFISDLYKKGVRCFVISEAIDSKSFADANFISVKDTIAALQNLTAAHRKLFNIPVFGITGSNGKTIVKEWLFQLLEPDYNIVRSPKSYNSQIGVPLSVWQIAPYHNLGIFEAGISQPDEMGNLEKIIQPTIGIFTNIGGAHNEGFLDIRQKVNEKLRLFTRAEIVIFCRDYLDINECLVTARDRMKKADSDFDGFKTFSWTRKNLDADVIINAVHKVGNYTEIDAQIKDKNYNFSIPFIDEASIENGINCWMLMMYMKMDPAVIAQRMLALNKIAMRLEMKDAINNCSLINDSYNSDLNSLNIAMDFLNQQKQHNRRTIILSDILQSGMSEDDLYKEVSQMVVTKGVSRIIGIGKSVFKKQKYFTDKINLESKFYQSTEEFLKDFQTENFKDETILLKGARSFEFERISKKLEQQAHETILEINLNHLAQNLEVYQSLLKPETKMMVMVKAYSYGSGSFEIASVLQQHKVDYLTVAYTDEGVELRKAGITMPIMVMNPEAGGYEDLIHYRLEPEMYNMRALRQFNSIAQNHHENYPKGYPVHIELETGMHRLGIEESELDEVIHLLTEESALQVQTVFSHLAASEDITLDDYTKTQITTFEKLSSRIISQLKYPVSRHILNSSGITRFTHAQFEMVRLGLGLYGIDSSKKLQQKLKPVGTLKTRVSQIKHLKAGETVGYNRAGKTEQDTIIATVGIGYADGLSRRLSNGVGQMLVKNKSANIIGKVCMDMTMLDVTAIPGVEEGDEVIVFGEELPLQTIAEKSGTIPYEVMTGISRRVKRVYFQE